MEVLLVFLVALALGLGYGTKAAATAVRGAYRGRRERWLAANGLADHALAQGHGDKSRAAGLKAGAAAATVVTGWRLGWRGFLRGFRLGWPQGRTSVDRWRDRFTDPEPVGETGQVNPDRCGWREGGRACGRSRLGAYCRRHNRAWLRGERDGDQTGCPWIPVGKSDPCAKPLGEGGVYCPKHEWLAEGRCRWAEGNAKVAKCIKPPIAGSPFCREHAAEFARRTDTPPPVAGGTEQEREPDPGPRIVRRWMSSMDKPDSKGAAPMAIETATGGEVLTKGQFDAEMEATKTEAQSEMEDAQGDLKRAEQDVQRVDLMVASLANAEVDIATQRRVAELAGTNGARVAAAQQRIAAAEQRFNAADAAVKTLNSARQTTFHAG